MESKELTLEQMAETRKIKGFPHGENGNLISLSRAPFYTAFPNPFIEDFITQYGTKYDEAKDEYNVEPYTDDVSEDKHDLIYNIHSYHTKVPPKAIQTFFEHYTKPGDIVLDVFAGSGMTGVAAQTCPTGGRNAILIDLSPYATFLTSNYNTPNDEKTVYELEKILDSFKAEFGDCYRTRHVENGVARRGINGEFIEGVINYTIWSDVFFCPHCGHEMIYYYDALDPMSKKALKKFNCKKCNFEITKANMVLKRETELDEKGCVRERAVKIPVLINYSVGTKRFTKEPDEEDINRIKQISINKWMPMDELPKGYNTEQPKHSHGMCWVNSFYTKRTAMLLSEFFYLIQNDNKKKFLFTSILPKMTLLNRYMPEHGSRALVGPMAGTYYVPSLSVENNVINQLEFQLQKLGHLSYKSGNCIVSTQSATDLRNIPANSVDYVFVDPPFGANIMYSELNFMAESWLGVKTNNTDEAIVNSVQNKALPEYSELMKSAFKELFRVIKPNRWITIEFHNSKNAVWNAIQQSIQEAGFVIADVRTLSKEKKTVMQYKSDNTVDQDLIISAYKPLNSFVDNFKLNIGSEDNVWEFVRQHLKKLPVAITENGKVQIIPERQAILLFDRMVAYHIMNGASVPLDATEFYAGLEQRYLKRDNMYFLPDQVNEYDMARSTSELEDVQLAFFVSDEKTAIGWLYRQLTIPMSYQELMPKFMQELKAVDKREKLPELLEILEENFLKDESGKWYIPDLTKAGDVAKLREKNLLKEFQEYLNSTGKLKVFRSEAIRVGFAKLWKEKNYGAIVKLAERLPEETIQEDPNLLMYYDISLSRV